MCDRCRCALCRAERQYGLSADALVIVYYLSQGCSIPTISRYMGMDAEHVTATIATALRRVRLFTPKLQRSADLADWARAQGLL